MTLMAEVVVRSLGVRGISNALSIYLPYMFAHLISMSAKHAFV